MPKVNRIDVKRDGMVYATRPGYYFGYGLESVPEVVERIVGRHLIYEPRVRATGEQLAVQDFDQVPNNPIADLGNRSPQQVLIDSWARFTDNPFSAYTLRQSSNRGDFVEGTLYELDMDSALALNDWNMVNPDWGNNAWRYWDHGITLSDGRRVSTLTVGDDQEVNHVVSGIDYEPFLNDHTATLQVINQFVADRQARQQ